MFYHSKTTWQWPNKKKGYVFQKNDFLKLQTWRLQPLKQAQNACFDGSRKAQMHQCAWAKIKKMSPPLLIFQNSLHKYYVINL